MARPVVAGYQPYDVVFKPLRDLSPALDLVVAWRCVDPSSNLQAFIGIVRELTLADYRSEPTTEEQHLLET